MTTLLALVPVPQLGDVMFGPGPGRKVEFLWKDGAPSRNIYWNSLYAIRTVFPVEACCGGRGLCEPLDGNVI